MFYRIIVVIVILDMRYVPLPLNHFTAINFESPDGV